MSLQAPSGEQRVLFLTDRVFWPANDGHKVVLSNYCKSLAEQYGCAVHILTFLEPGQSPESLSTLPSYIASAELMEKPSKIEVMRNILSLLLCGPGDEPAQCCLFKSKIASAQLKAAINRIRPSHVFLDLPRLSPFVGCIKEYPGKKIIYLEDLFSRRYARQSKSLNTLNRTGGVAGKYSVDTSGMLGKIASTKIVEKGVLRFESKRMERLEHDVVKKFDYVVLVSPEEAKELARETGAQNVVAVPLGVDCSFYTSGPHPEEREGVLSFLGDMRSSANADSLRYIVNEVLPLLADNVVLEVSGTAPNELKQEFNRNSQVRFLGRVEDTREVLRSSQVFLAPIAYGSGIKTKILEAMAIGVPIVTNSIGNEGIGLTDEIDALVDDDREAIARDVTRLLKDRQLAHRLVKSARDKVVRDFDWQKSLATFSRLGFSQTNLQT